MVGIGHTDATYEQARAAMARGVHHAIHVYNAMRPFSHRDSGVIGAVLTTPEVTAELIADGVHVDETAMRLLLQAKGAGGVILISDGISATGMPDGKYSLGKLEVTVSGGVCRDAEGRLAGSTLTLDRALRNIVNLGASLADALRMLTLNPAKLLGIEFKKGSLRTWCRCRHHSAGRRPERRAGLDARISQCLLDPGSRLNSVYNLFIQRDIQFFGKLLGAERAAGKIAIADFQCGHFALAIVGAHDDRFAQFHLPQYLLREIHAAFLQKALRPVAVRAPRGAVDRNLFHAVLRKIR